MKLKTRIACALLAGGMAVSMSACSKNYEWVAKTEEYQMGPGVYMGLLLNSYMTALDQTQDKDTPILKQTIEDKNASDWIAENAQELVREYFAIEHQFDEMGLILNSDEQTSIESTASTYWEYQSSLYEDNGMSQESLKSMLTNSYKQQMIFQKLYDTDGLEEVPESELQEEFKNNYLKTTFYPLALTDSSGNAVSDEDKAAIKERLNTILTKAQQGEDFYDLILADEKEAAGEGTVHEHTGTEHDSIFSKSDADYLPENFYNSLKAIGIGEYGVFEVEGYMVVAYRGELPLEGDEYTQYRSTLLSSVRSEDFYNKLQEWAKDVQVTYADGALKTFTPKKVKYEPATSSSSNS